MACRDRSGPGNSGTVVPEPTAFALSRIQAEGWRAGRQIDAADNVAAIQAEALNPYQNAAERARWQAGFDAGRVRSRR